MRPRLKSPIRNVHLIVVCVNFLHFLECHLYYENDSYWQSRLVYVLYMFLQKIKTTKIHLQKDLGKIPSNLISKVVID